MSDPRYVWAKSDVNHCPLCRVAWLGEQEHVCGPVTFTRFDPIDPHAHVIYRLKCPTCNIVCETSAAPGSVRRYKVEEPPPGPVGIAWVVGDIVNDGEEKRRLNRNADHVETYIELEARREMRAGGCKHA